MATEKLSEQELQLRKRARRRLVGAIALVLLMITVLPMVLDDHEVQVPQSEIAISIPGKDGDDFTSRIVPAEPAPMEEPAAPAQATAPAEPAKVEAAAEPARPEAPPAPQPSRSEPAKSEPAASQGSGNFVVQVGVYSDAGNVQRLQKKLSELGYQSYTENLETQKGSKIRLRVGPFAGRTEAEKALAGLKAAELSGIVVTK